MHPSIILGTLAAITLIAYIYHRRYFHGLEAQSKNAPTSLSLRTRIKFNAIASNVIAILTVIFFFAAVLPLGLGYSINQHEPSLMEQAAYRPAR